MQTYSVQRPPLYESTKNYDSTRGHEGVYEFYKDQLYEGEFFRESFHGEGFYKWTCGMRYEGGFYSNCMEGYGSFSFPDSSYFEGLFIGNKPFGPGIYTYPNGRQDAGFWLGKKLVRLSRPVDFIIPRLAATSAGKIKLLKFRRLIPLDEEYSSATNILLKYDLPLENFPDPYSQSIYDRRSIFFDKQTFERAYFAPSKVRPLVFPCPSPCVILSGDLDEEVGEEEDDDDEDGVMEKVIPPHCLCPNDVFVMKYDSQKKPDICETESGRSSSGGEKAMGIMTYLTRFSTDGRYESEMGENGFEFMLGESYEKEDEESIRDETKIPRIVSWNRSELCTEILKQIFRFRDFEGKLNFNLSKLMVGARTAFRKTGENEKQCIHFLKMCSLGPAHEIKSILCSYSISEELMDARGNNSLMFAAATDQHDVIDVLLNYGVDLNTFNDEGLTPLNLCLLRRITQTNGIVNWEAAFLGKETDGFQEVDSQTQEYPLRESISSLDRIFGDGMSIADSETPGMDSRMMSPLMSPLQPRSSLERKHSSDGGKEGSRSCLAVNAGSTSKSIGSFSVLNWEWDFRHKKASILTLSNPTPTLNMKLIPKSVRRDEYQRSVQKTSKQKYFFGFNFENPSQKEKPVDAVKKKKVKKVKNDYDWVEEEEEKQEEEEEKEFDPNDLNWDVELNERISNIDKTIQMLLSRGADPNRSEVPKPSTHLGVYTKDLKTLRNLLAYGADPDSPLSANEGRLTPLHVITLRESAPEYVELCQLLLNYKANPDAVTIPEFTLTQDEKQYLEPDCGRTPLQLLCMRPDLQYADPDGNLIAIGLLLAKVCQRKLLYNGHSYLTLAMLFNNVKLLDALLHTKYFDPKAILGKNRGTCLHVLVSTELQKRTPYETSIKMCKLLIRAGADPMKRFKHPKSLRGTCVDYGKREIEAEKKARKAAAESADGKQSGKRQKDKTEERDHLKDHQRVVEYLAKMTAHAGKKKFETVQVPRQGESGQKMRDERPVGDGRKKKPVLKEKERREDVEKNVKFGSGRGTGKDGRDESRGISGEGGEGHEGREGGGVSDDYEEGGERGAGTAEDEKAEYKRRKRSTRAYESMDAENIAGLKDNARKRDEGGMYASKKDENTEDVFGKTAKDRKSMSEKTKKDRKDVSGSMEEIGESFSRKKKDKTKGKPGHRDREDDTEREDTEMDEYSRKSKSKTEKGTDDVKKGRSKKGEKTKKESSVDVSSRKGMRTERKENKEGDKHSRAGKLRRSISKITTNYANINAPRSKFLSRSQSEKAAASFELFPEKLRQLLLRLYGNCSKMDINEFLMPYVVLRDGELYYKFKTGTSKQKEQYSLI